MRNNETGEFELVIGNRQLLSGFFIVVLLFAVAFAMGYILGQNSPRPARPQAEAAPAQALPAAAADARPQASSPVPAAQPPASKGGGAGSGTQAADAGPQPTTQPARETEPATVVQVPAPAAEGAPGSYWQVIATANQDSAHAILQSLKDKGFPASLTPGPSNLTRVLVGPFADTAALGRAKTELENAGFHSLVRK